MWTDEQDHQTVFIHGLEVEVRLGVFAKERQGRQRLGVDVELFRHGGHYLGGGLGECLDYNRIHDHVTRDWPQLPHTELVEELGERLVAFIFEDPRVDACRVVLRKPDIYGRPIVPGIALFRRRPG